MQLGPINLTSIIEALYLARLSFVLTFNCVTNIYMLYASVQTEFSNSSFKLLSAMLYSYWRDYIIYNESIHLV